MHGTFTSTIELPVARHDVFAAYSELPLRKKWFRMPGTPVGDHTLDFRVDGGESLAARFAPMGDRIEHLAYHSQFLHIAPDERIVYSYTFDLDGQRRWASLVTVELLGQGDGTLLRHIEQYAFLAVTGDGRDDVAHLKGGTQLQLNGLLAALKPTE